MPVSNNFIKSQTVSSNNIDLTGISGLNTSYRYFKEGFYKLNPDQPSIIVPATSSKVNREVYINYKEELNPNNTNRLSLYFGSKNQHPKTIEINGGYLDTSDGGIALIAECSESAIVEITIRQDSEIAYTIGNHNLGDEMPVELIIRPIIQTGTLYSMPPLAPTVIGEANLRKVIDSNNGLISGTKAWAIDSFQDGKIYNFQVNPNGILNAVIPLRILLVKVEDILKCLASFDASDNAELDQFAIASDLIGWVKSRSFYSEIDLGESQSFSLKPTRTRYLLAFDGGNPATPGYTDTIISDYSRNTIDPYEGGTFTFLGF
ncbi:conserved hypothetical protein [Planktothrix serta PCC 8927]|uniref:Uncharacterized protein n=1 Tax=Planktothrix serta PCC 8927 TaxID=671068 RepID=A0A7Z9BKH8_9CYAN|nr:hypothetical protein [Planktothrix serta]VXD15995.1 conserved hypothetical protein [Planktothrix serta PCC 8927]